MKTTVTESIDEGKAAYGKRSSRAKPWDANSVAMHRFPHGLPFVTFARRCAALECVALRRGELFVVSASPAMRIIQETHFAGIEPAARGKVRDIYDLGDQLLIVATDRLSAFDVVMPTPIPDKGKVLTQISLFWFDLLKEVIPNHVLSADNFPAPFSAYRDQLAGRSMLVRKTNPLPIECVVRGYLSGSGWKEYKSTGKVCGIGLPARLRESDQLPEPIF